MINTLSGINKFKLTEKSGNEKRSRIYQHNRQARTCMENSRS